LIVAAPPLRVIDVFCENEPIPWGLPVGDATRDTLPVALVGDTLTLKVTGVPCGIVKGAAGVVLIIVTVSAVNDAVDHFVRRFPTFSEPRPVAKS
jgi:hypothetical protein